MGFGNWQNFFVAWIILSSFLATGPQYVMVVLFLAWLLWQNAWRDRSLWQLESKVIVGGVVVASLLTLLSAVSGWILESATAGFGNLAYDVYHLTAKWTVRCLIIIGGFLWLKKRELGFVSCCKWLIPLLLINLIYCVYQRYTGIDLVHGWNAILPENRYNYGVFRVSGFAGHPLSLGYNSLLMAVIGLIHFRFEGYNTSKESWLYFLLFFNGFLLLVLTQSRWPLLLLLAVTGIQAFTLLKGRLGRFAWLKGLLAVFGVLAMLSGGMKGRLLELGDSTRDLSERIPRLVFWQVHWQMFQDHPLLGVGLADRNSDKLDYYSRSGYNTNGKTYSAHNIYLQTLADSGIIGFFGLLAILASSTWLGIYKMKRGDPRLLTYMGVIWLAGFMQNTFRDSEFIYAYWLGLALILTTDASKYSMRKAVQL